MSSARSPDLKRVILSAGLTMIAALVAVLCIVDFSSRAIDDISKKNEEGLIKRAIARELQHVAEDVASAALWNDAYEALRSLDQDWLQTNFGDYYADYMDHDLTVAYDARGVAVYASRESEHVDPASEAAFVDAVAPMVARVRHDAVGRRFDKRGHRNIEFAAVAKANGLVRVGQDIYVVSVSTVVPDQPLENLSDEPDGVVASGRRISTLLTAVSNDLGISNPAVVSHPDVGGAATPLTGLGGETLGAIAWTPAKPGAVILNQALLLIVGVTIALGLAALLLFRHVTRILDRLAQNRAALTASLADLTVARDAAQAANKAKSQFLASISHEIRTPLNGILGMAQSLAMSPLVERDRQKVDIILSSGHNLTAILNDVLDISKIEAGRLEIAPVRSDLLALCNQTFDLFQPLAVSKGLFLRFEHDELEHAHFNLDPVRFQQCLANLLSNAIKFTRSGGVTLTLRIWQAGDVWRIALDVTDTGIGMSQKTVDRLFDNFMQADVSTTREFGGTGLGLAISRRLARLMDGDITVESAPSGGSTFTLTVCAAVAGAAQAPALQLAEHSPVGTAALSGTPRVLIVDDNAINRQVARLFLAEEKLDLVEAVNGEDALEKLAASHFDLVLLDVHMPVMDGRQCIARIRTAETPWRTVPVIALTAEAMEGDRERLLEAGMTDYAAKPIDRAVLVQKVNRLLGRGAAEAVHAAAGSAGGVMDDAALDDLLDGIDRAVA